MTAIQLILHKNMRLISCIVSSTYLSHLLPPQHLTIMGASSATTDNNDNTSIVIKAAKKELKRSDSNSLKIKQLTKSLIN